MNNSHFCIDCGTGLTEQGQYCTHCGAPQQIVCPCCGAANQPGVRFCTACGEGLLLPCSGCGHINRPEDRYCSQCHLDLQALVTQATASSLSGQGKSSPKTMLGIVLLLGLASWYGLQSEPPAVLTTQSAVESSGAVAESSRYNAPTAPAVNHSVSAVTVQPECIGFLCIVEKFSLSGGPGFISEGFKMFSLTDIGQGIAGTYHYSVYLTPSNKHCGGSFYISGEKEWVTVNVHEHNCESYTHEH